MQSSTLYEQVLQQLATGEELPLQKPPRDSASVVLWRRNTAREIEVFWVRRSPQLAFMAGWHAFPGGVISRSDSEIAVKGVLGGIERCPESAAMPPAVVNRLEDLSPLFPDGLMVGAIRELFEETGLLVAQNVGTRSQLAAARRRLLAEEISFASLLKELDVELEVTDLIYAGRWLTPPLGPLRFDNRFFLLEWPADRNPQPEVNAEEADIGEWIAPQAGLDLWKKGSVITAPPILHILQVLGESGEEFDLDRLHEPVEANLGPFRKVEFRPGVLLFPLATPTLPPAQFTNAYLLGTREAVLIDPGSPFEREIGWLIEGLRETEHKLNRRVSAIWLTHHHPDHVGGVEALRQELNVPVCAHRLSAERLEQASIPVDRLLEDGEVVILEGNPPVVIRVFHTPGHASGHLCFYEEAFGSLVAGDLVAGFGTIVVDPPDGNMSDYMVSLEKMRRLAPQTLFPAHGPTIRGAVKKLDDYMNHRLDRERQILQAWRAGITDPLDILQNVYEDLPVFAEPLAVRQIEAHLALLRARGQLA
jgi:glyoxylase-like metal-dependent hydrolase (beta-lactamase superfamily II)/8-oxo-dGTP pyrophosphatase MutT (NUDIX family)